MDKEDNLKKQLNKKKYLETDTSESKIDVNTKLIFTDTTNPSFKNVDEMFSSSNIYNNNQLNEINEVDNVVSLRDKNSVMPVKEGNNRNYMEMPRKFTDKSIERKNILGQVQGQNKLNFTSQLLNQQNQNSQVNMKEESNNSNNHLSNPINLNNLNNLNQLQQLQMQNQINNSKSQSSSSFLAEQMNENSLNNINNVGGNSSQNKKQVHPLSQSPILQSKGNPNLTQAMNQQVGGGQGQFNQQNYHGQVGSFSHQENQGRHGNFITSPSSNTFSNNFNLNDAHDNYSNKKIETTDFEDELNLNSKEEKSNLLNKSSINFGKRHTHNNQQSLTGNLNLDRRRTYLASSNFNQLDDLDDYYRKFSHLYVDVESNQPQNNITIIQNENLSRRRLTVVPQKTKSSNLLSYVKVKSMNQNNDNSCFIRRTSNNNVSNIRDTRKQQQEEFNSNKSLIESNLNPNMKENTPDSFIEDDREMGNSFLNITEKPFFPMVQNITSNISDIKSQLTNYEKAYESIQQRIEKDNKEKLAKIYNENEELKKKLIEEKHSKEKLKDYHDREVMMKEEAFLREKSLLKEQMESQMKKQQEENDRQWGERLIYLENEVNALRQRNIELETENSILKHNDKKKEIIEYQKKYLSEMKELQATFEDFKIKAYAEFKKLKGQREEEKAKVVNLQNLLAQTQKENELNETNIKETESMFKSKAENIKQLVKANEILKIEVDNAKKEIDYLKHQVSILSEKERKLQAVALENDYISDKLEELGLNLTSINNLDVSGCMNSSTLNEYNYGFNATLNSKYSKGQQWHGQGQQSINVNNVNLNNTQTMNLSHSLSGVGVGERKNPLNKTQSKKYSNTSKDNLNIINNTSSMKFRERDREKEEFFKTMTASNQSNSNTIKQKISNKIIPSDDESRNFVSKMGSSPITNQKDFFYTSSKKNINENNLHDNSSSNQFLLKNNRNENNNNRKTPNQTSQTQNLNNQSQIKNIGRKETNHRNYNNVNNEFFSDDNLENTDLDDYNNYIDNEAEHGHEPENYENDNEEYNNHENLFSPNSPLENDEFIMDEERVNSSNKNINNSNYYKGGQGHSKQVNNKLNNNSISNYKQGNLIQQQSYVNMKYQNHNQNSHQFNHLSGNKLQNQINNTSNNNINNQSFHSRYENHNYPSTTNHQNNQFLHSTAQNDFEDEVNYENTLTNQFSNNNNKKINYYNQHLVQLNQENENSIQNNQSFQNPQQSHTTKKSIKSKLGESIGISSESKKQNKISQFSAGGGNSSFKLKNNSSINPYNHQSQQHPSGNINNQFNFSNYNQGNAKYINIDKLDEKQREVAKK